MSDNWTLLTSHGHVLFFVAAEPNATVRQITDAIGISERRVSSILHDLEAAGMMSATRVGTGKHYEVNADAHFRHPTLSHIPLRDVLAQIQPRDVSQQTVRWRR